jgi:hypothetical protein
MATIADQGVVRTQYATSANLGARQAIWRHGQSLVDMVLELAELSGDTAQTNAGPPPHVVHIGRGSRRQRPGGAAAPERKPGDNLASNLLVVCRFCHEDIESRREHALELG